MFYIIICCLFTPIYRDHIYCWITPDHSG